MITLEIKLGGCLVLAMMCVIFVGCTTSSQPIGQPDAKGSDAQLAEARKKVPVHPWHKERVENIRREDVKRLIENLANFDDDQFASDFGSGYIRGNVGHEVYRIVRLSRVRRLLQMGMKEPDLVAAALRKALTESLDQWPQAYQERVQLWKDNPQGFTSEKPRNYVKVRTRAMVATYLLAEAGDFDSLPLLLHSYKVQEKWIVQHKYYPAIQYPVHPAITLYAMHRLVSNYPQERLTEQTRALRDAHLKWAEENLPPMQVITGTSWNSDYQESDPLVRIIDPRGVVLWDQRKIQLVVYPHEFGDGEDFRWMLEDKVDERTQRWLDQIRQFVKAAYPDANLPQRAQ